MKFTKMHGIGNDYVYVDCTKKDLAHTSEIAKYVSDRHFGIGSDGMILIKSSEKADFQMDMYNADGSRGEMCGNGIRCVAKYVYDHHLTDKTEISIDTLAGIKYLKLTVENGKVVKVRVNMGQPILAPDRIPVIAEKEPVVAEPIEVCGKEWKMTCVSMGNPHAVTFVENVMEYPIEKYGRVSEFHPIFPDRVNTEFVEIVDDSHVKMRVWERGSGETWACGTGASATAVACVLNGKTDRKVDVELIGGTLTIEWNAEDNHVYMTGSAEFSFDGEWLREV